MVADKIITAISLVQYIFFFPPYFHSKEDVVLGHISIIFPVLTGHDFMLNQKISCFHFEVGKSGA